MPEGPEKPLVCPECGLMVRWNGAQFLCSKCPWTEHKAKPPSSHKIALPDEFRRPRSAE